MFAAIKRAYTNDFSTWFFSGFILKISNLAFSLIVFFIIYKATETIKLGIRVWDSHNSSANYCKLQKAESQTIPDIEGSLSMCIKDVTAPILLPQSAICDTFLL